MRASNHKQQDAYYYYHNQLLQSFVSIYLIDVWMNKKNEQDDNYKKKTVQKKNKTYPIPNIYDDRKNNG
jgi:hypothetical protein